MLLFVIKQVSQSHGWHHIVMSLHVDGVTRIGTAKLYFDGRRVGTTELNSKFTSYPANCACRFFHTTCKICIKIFKALLFIIAQKVHIYTNDGVVF